MLSPEAKCPKCDKTVINVNRHDDQDGTTLDFVHRYPEEPALCSSVMDGWVADLIVRGLSVNQGA